LEQRFPRIGSGLAWLDGDEQSVVAAGPHVKDNHERMNTRVTFYSYCAFDTQLYAAAVSATNSNPESVCCVHFGFVLVAVGTTVQSLHE
jgi:hypothetical protein